jgi:hypothetical protein
LDRRSYQFSAGPAEFRFLAVAALICDDRHLTAAKIEVRLSFKAKLRFKNLAQGVLYQSLLVYLLKKLAEQLNQKQVPGFVADQTVEPGTIRKPALETIRKVRQRWRQD